MAHTPPKANGSCSSHPLGLMGIAVSALGSPFIRPNPPKVLPNSSLGPYISKCFLPRWLCMYSFSFFAFFFFPLFYYCFNNNKRPEAVKLWPGPGGPWGFGAGGGGSQWGSEVEGEEKESWELGKAQESCVPAPPPSPCLHVASHALPKVLRDKTPCPRFLTDLSPPTFSFSSAHGLPGSFPCTSPHLHTL